MHFFPYFDTHCDTLSKMYTDGKSLNDASLQVNLKNMFRYRYAVQVFAFFNDGNYTESDTVSAFNILRNECNRFGRFISVQCSTLGIRRNFKARRATAIPAIEAVGNQPDFTVDCIGRFRRLGVRFMSLCWNNDNILCGGSGKNICGLTALGIQTLKEMQNQKVILDVSHMSDQSFYQAIEIYKLPFCATHSGSRHICSHNRNITDQQFKVICDRGGVCGINLYPPFISHEKCDISSIIKHIEHFLSLGGENNIGIGADFDGVDLVADDIADSGFVYRLFDSLLSLNYKESLINKIAFYNFYNFMSKFEICD